MPIDNELPNHNADNGHAQVARTDFDNSTAALERNAEFQLSAALSAQPFPATADDALARNWPIPTRDTPLGVLRRYPASFWDAANPPCGIGIGDVRRWMRVWHSTSLTYRQRPGDPALNDTPPWGWACLHAASHWWGARDKVTNAPPAPPPTVAIPVTVAASYERLVNVAMGLFHPNPADPNGPKHTVWCIQNGVTPHTPGCTADCVALRDALQAVADAHLATGNALVRQGRSDIGFPPSGD